MIYLFALEKFCALGMARSRTLENVIKSQSYFLHPLDLLLNQAACPNQADKFSSSSSSFIIHPLQNQKTFPLLKSFNKSLRMKLHSCVCFWAAQFGFGHNVMLKFRSLSNVHLGPEGEISFRPWPESGGWVVFKDNQGPLTRRGAWGRRTDASPISQMKKLRLRHSW